MESRERGSRIVQITMADQRSHRSAVVLLTAGVASAAFVWVVDDQPTSK